MEIRGDLNAKNALLGGAFVQCVLVRLLDFLPDVCGRSTAVFFWVFRCERSDKTDGFLASSSKMLNDNGGSVVCWVSSFFRSSVSRAASPSIFARASCSALWVVKGDTQATSMLNCSSPMEMMMSIRSCSCGCVAGSCCSLRLSRLQSSAS